MTEAIPATRVGVGTVWERVLTVVTIVMFYSSVTRPLARDLWCYAAISPSSFAVAGQYFGSYLVFSLDFMSISSVMSVVEYYSSASGP